MKNYPDITPKQTMTEFLASVKSEFETNNIILDTEYYIWVSSYTRYDPEYGRSEIVPARCLYGPYDTREEAQEVVDALNADPSLRPSPATAKLEVRVSNLIERTEVRRFWS